MMCPTLLCRSVLEISNARLSSFSTTPMTVNPLHSSTQTGTTFNKQSWKPFLQNTWFLELENTHTLDATIEGESGSNAVATVNDSTANVVALHLQMANVDKLLRVLILGFC